MKKCIHLSILSLILLQSHSKTCAEKPLMVTVFCSADNKISQQFKSIAYNLGKQLGSHNFGLITGGSRTGLMKEVVDGYVSVASSLQNLYGVMPKVLLKYDVHHLAIPQENLKWVETLHSRLATCHELSDVIVVLPGGFGTLHELMDFLVHNQFGLSKKPILLINVGGYWNYLLLQFKTMAESKLLSPKHLTMISVVNSEDECLEKIKNEGLNVQEGGLSNHYWE